MHLFIKRFINEAFLKTNMFTCIISTGQQLRKLVVHYAQEETIKMTVDFRANNLKKVLIITAGT